jgi:hypothetical protein
MVGGSFSQNKSHMMMMIHLCLLELMARRLLRARLSLLHLVFKLVFCCCLATYLTCLSHGGWWVLCWITRGTQRNANTIFICQNLSPLSDIKYCPYFSLQP